MLCVHAASPNYGVLAVLQLCSLVVICPRAAEALQWRLLTDGNALCNDFSQAGYYDRLNSSSTDWAIFFESGGACYSVETCNRKYLRREVRQRYGGGLITEEFNLARAWNESKNRKSEVVSPLMTSVESFDIDLHGKIEGYDLLSTDCGINPDFCYHNHILVPYCSSDLWLGNDTRFGSDTANHSFIFNPEATDLQFIFRGFVIFRSVFQEIFLSKFSGNVLLAGSSAGGVGVINHLNWVKQFLPAADIRVFTESSWFVNFHDNIYRGFTNFVDISEESRASNFNITEYVESQNETSLYTLILHHEPCNSIDLGTPCCISIHCLISNSDYVPTNIPILVTFSIYDVYLLGPSLRGLQPFNPPMVSYDAQFENRGEESEPVGLNFDFLRVIGEYGGTMNNTLATTSHQAAHLSYYVTSCFQHIYLATSSLWDEGGLFGSDPFEVTNENGATLIRNTVQRGRWDQFRLTQGTGSDLNNSVSIREAVGVWLTTANETHPVQFRESCHVAHCNDLCPEEIFELVDSNLWSNISEIFVYVVVGMVTLFCFITKGIFFLWHRWLLRRQEMFLCRSRDAVMGHAIYQIADDIKELKQMITGINENIMEMNKRLKRIEDKITARCTNNGFVLKQ